MAVTAGRASTTRRRVRDAAWRDCPSGEWPVNRFGTNAAAGGLERSEHVTIRRGLHLHRPPWASTLPTSVTPSLEGRRLAVRRTPRFGWVKLSAFVGPT